MVDLSCAAASTAISTSTEPSYPKATVSMTTLFTLELVMSKNCLQKLFSATGKKLWTNSVNMDKLHVTSILFSNIVSSYIQLVIVLIICRVVLPILSIMLTIGLLWKLYHSQSFFLVANVCFWVALSEMMLKKVQRATATLQFLHLCWTWTIYTFLPSPRLLPIRVLIIQTLFMKEGMLSHYL